MIGIQGVANPVDNHNYIWNTDTLAWEAATGSIAPSGTVTVNNFPATQTIYDPAGDVTAIYKISDMDTASDPSYFGYLDATGAWYILKLTESTGAARYIKGSSGYTTSWSGRAGLSYNYFDSVF